MNDEQPFDSTPFDTVPHPKYTEEDTFQRLKRIPIMEANDIVCSRVRVAGGRAELSDVLAGTGWTLEAYIEHSKFIPGTWVTPPADSEGGTPD